jgi:cephalosporin hydroxylase
MKYRHSLTSFVHRVRAFLKPTTRTVPADVAAILGATQGNDIVQRFNDFYYASRGSLRWRGINLIKNPCDLWTMIDLVQELRPGLVIETGTAEGGSATFYSDLASLFGVDMRIVTIDINPKWSFDPATRNIVSLVGYSTDRKIQGEVLRLRETAQRDNRAVLVCLDSDHSAANVLEELDLYARATTVGSYCIVEDTNVNGHPSYSTHGPGPWEAVQTFIGRSDDFTIDLERQSYLLTFNPNGYLRRIK